MRRILYGLLVLVCLLVPVRVDAALTVVQRTDTGGLCVNGTCCTNNFASPVTAGNLLVTLFHTNGTATGGSDTLGNTFVATTSTPSGGNDGIYYAKNIVGGTDAPCVSQSSVFTWAAAYEISGADGTSPFVTDSAVSSSGSTIASGTLSLSGTSSIILAWISASNTYTANAGYTQFSTDVSNHLYDQYHITASDEAAGGTQTGTGAWSIIAAAFKSGGGGGSPAPTRLPLLGVGPGH